MYAADIGSTAAPEMSVFHGLEGRKTGHGPPAPVVADEVVVVAPGPVAAVVAMEPVVAVLIVPEAAVVVAPPTPVAGPPVAEVLSVPDDPLPPLLDDPG